MIIEGSKDNCNSSDHGATDGLQRISTENVSGRTTGDQDNASCAPCGPVSANEHARQSHERGLRFCPATKLLVGLYSCGGRLLRQRILRLANYLEGGVYFSGTLREILRRHHGVSVGAYTYGLCMVPGAFPSGVTIGRYCSIATGVRVFLRNHPLDRLSTHPFFYNKAAGFVDADTVASGTLEIGHDVWIGAGAIITPACSRIGVGAVVGCGAVVTRDVDEFAVVAGNPANLLRYRFPRELRRIVLQSCWWEKPVEDVVKTIEHMVRPLGPPPWAHPLLKDRSEYVWHP
jgi:virginiamycin A acetyltransferase